MSIAAKAIQDFNNSISQYGDLENAVNSYVSAKKNDVYEDWKSGLLNQLNIDQERKQQMDEIIGLGSATFGAGVSAYRKYKANQANKKAAGETADDAPGGESTGAEDGGDKSGETEDVEDVGDEVNTSGESPDLADEDEPELTQTAVGEGAEVEMTPISSAIRPPTPYGGETGVARNIETGGEGAADVEETGAGVYSRGLGTDLTQGSPFTRGTRVDDMTDTEEADEAEGTEATEAAEIADAGEEAGTAAAEGVGTAAAEAVAGEAAGTALGAAAGVALDALGPVGMAAGLGLSLYEFFHGESSAKKAAQKAPQSVSNPYIQTAFNTADNIVLPSESNILDTVGGHSVF